MYYAIETPLETLLAQINSRIQVLYENVVQGYLFENIELDAKRKSIFLNIISHDMLGKTKLETKMPIMAHVKLLTKQGKEVSATISNIIVQVKILTDTPFELNEQRSLRQLFEGTITKVRYEIINTYSRIFDQYGKEIEITQCSQEGVLFTTVYESDFINIVDNIASRNYVKKPSIKNIDDMIQYYLQRDAQIIALYRPILESVQQDMYRKEWYVYRNLPIYKKHMPTKDTIFITATFGLLWEYDSNNILVLYDYKKKIPTQQMIQIWMDDFNIPYEDIDLVSTLYNYSLTM